MPHPRSRLASRGASLIAFALSAAAIAAGCSGADADTAARDRGRCEDAFAANVSTGGLTGLDATIRQCVDWDDWFHAAGTHPAMLGGRDPMAVLGERCSDDTSGLDGYAVCGSLALARATPTPTPRRTRVPVITPRPVARARATQRPQPRTAARPASVIARHYPNCTALQRDYPHGVGKPGAVDRGGGVRSFVRSSALYAANAGSDGDRDGVACEKR